MRRNIGKRKKEAICLGIALLCGALLTGFLLVQRGMLVEARARRAGQDLSREVLRFHVLADSDGEADQQRKMEVKEALLDYMEGELPQEANLEETCSWVRDNLDELEDVINQQADKGYVLHTLTTTNSGNKGIGGNVVQATMVFEKIQ